jgi:Raf kinase inhibitor-like YbhB/YbcL family protein
MAQGGASDAANGDLSGWKLPMRKLATMALAIVGGFESASAATAMTLTSPEVKPGQKMADEQACTGGNVSPALAWSGAPQGAKSFAISVYDLDADFWHWWVANLPANATSLPKGASSGTGLPGDAVQARNDFGGVGYGGPCPPKGKPHHYQFTVYALDVDKIPPDAAASPAAISAKVRAHTLAKATLTGLYGR